MATFEGVTKENLKQLVQKGFYYMDTKTPYEEARMGGPCVLVLYKSGKLLVQGPESLTKDVHNLLLSLNFRETQQQTYPQILNHEEGTYIGSDESLKGDTFGGIVVAAVKCNALEREQLMQHNITDSKLIYDHNIPGMAAAIRRICRFEIRSIMPEEYNQNTSTALLNRLHGECINALLPADKIVVDKYPGCDLPVIQETKAELKYVEVAAASILARDMALKQLATLSELAGFKVPKGSSDVKNALLKAINSDIPIGRLVKLHFTNVQEMLKKHAKDVY